MSKIEIILNEKPEKKNKGDNSTSLAWDEVVQALQYVGLIKKGDIPHRLEATSRGIEITYLPPEVEKRVQE